MSVGTKEQLVGAATGGGGGRGNKGRKRGLSKTGLQKFKSLQLGQGKYVHTVQVKIEFSRCLHVLETQTRPYQKIFDDLFGG